MGATEPTEISTVLSLQSGNTVTLYASDDPEGDAKEEAKKTGKGVYINTSVPATNEQGVTVYKTDDDGEVYIAVQNSVSDWGAIRARYGHGSEFQAR